MTEIFSPSVARSTADPAPTAPVIGAHRVNSEWTGPISLFADDVWWLDPLGLSDGTTRVGVRWRSWPAEFRGSAKVYAHRAVNQSIPQAVLNRAGTSRVEWPSARTLRGVVSDWRQFAVWLASHDVQSLREVRPSHLEQWFRFATESGAPATQSRRLRAITYLWSIAAEVGDLPPNELPFWETEDLTLSDASNENKTAVIHPSVMAPLLQWALIMTGAIADDVIAARRHVDTRLASVASHNTAVSRTAARTFGEALPSNVTLPGRLHHGVAAPAAAYLALRDGTMNPRDVKYGLDHAKATYDVDLELAQPLDLPVSGSIEGQPWTENLDFRHLDTYVNALTGACLVLIGYLTGMRPQEARTLRRGCISTHSDGPTGTVRHRITGRVYKRVTVNGRTTPEGKERSWVTLAPVARAVEVLERLHSGDYLTPTSRDPEKAMNQAMVNRRIQSFISFANSLHTDLHLPEPYRIPDDNAGPVTAKRFRRTLAWHIRRRPGGQVALAVQYGHLSLRQGEGYAGLKEIGLMTMLDEEEASAVVDTLHRLRTAVEEGEGISGPAADRLLNAITKTAQYEGAYLTKRDVDRIKADSDLQIFDNPNAYLICVFDRTKSKCSNGDAPNLSVCSPDCANAVRTDSTIASLRAKSARLRVEASDHLTPEPQRLRLQHVADAYDSVAKNHEASRETRSARYDSGEEARG